MSVGSNRGSFSLEHLKSADRFIKMRLALYKMPQAELEKAASSAVITLAEASTLCNTSARKLWEYAANLPDALPLYNSNTQAEDFLNATFLLQDVIAFYCAQETLIRKRRSQSYQQAVMQLIFPYSEQGDKNAMQAEAALSSYFKMPCSEAIRYELTAEILYMFFQYYPTHQPTPEMAEEISSVVVKELRGEPTSPSPAGQEGVPLSSDHPGSRKDKPRIDATRQACEEVRKEIEQGKHLFEVPDKDKTNLKHKHKTNHMTFLEAVRNKLAPTKPHLETVEVEWKKVPAHIKHNGRVPVQ